MTFVEHDDFQQGSTSNEPQVEQQRHQYYGSELGDANFVDDDDDYEFLLDEGLARDGLYRGSYRNLLLLYTVVPLTTLLSFICLALVPTLLVSTTQTPSLFPYPPYLPFPILEVLTATALWSLSYLLRDFLYATALFIVPSFLSSFSTIIITILSATLQTTSNLLLRQIAIPILLIPYYSSNHLAQDHHYPSWKDDAFKRVWWVALGWAAAEAVVGVKQGYESIALYKDVLVNVNMSSTLNTEMGSRERPAAPKKQNENEREDVDTTTTITSKQMDWENQRRNRDSTSSPHIQQQLQQQHSLSTGSNILTEAPISDERQPLLGILTTRLDDESDERLQAENDVERDLDQLIALKNREELEEVYGIPVIRIPVFISCLHRINSILSSLGICLLLTAAYMQSTFAIIAPSSPSPLDSISIVSLHPSKIASNQQLAITTPPLLIIYTLLAMTHTPLILPRIGIHTFVYVELLVSLGVFFGGLAVWDALS